jgi:hypothetical protein
MVPTPDGVVDTTLVGHTRIADAGTVATSRARVGPTVKVIFVSVAAPVYVADRRPPTTAVPIALNDPPDVAIPSVVGVTENVTGTFTAEPETSVSPLTISPSVTVPTAATAIGGVRRASVYPSGARTTTANRKEPELGATDPSVYLPIDAVFDTASNAKLATVPYVDPVATDSTAVTELTEPARPVNASTIALVFPSPHTTVPPSCALGP